MTDPIRVGVVGLGHFGSHHARHYAAHPDADLVAVVDIDRRRAADTGTRYGATAVDDLDAFAARVKAASVAVPTSAHHSVAGDLIDRGVDVLVEKPIAADSASAADLVARADRAGAVLQVGHIERFSPAFAALASRAHRPGLIECVRRTPWSGRATDADVVLDLMIHDIDLALVLAAAPVAAVAAWGASVLSETSDVAEARLTFANGIVATLAASRIAPKRERTLIVTEPDRQWVADLVAPGLSLIRRTSGTPAIETVALARSDSLAAEIDAFLQSVATRLPPPVDGAAGLDAMRVAERILSAIAEAHASPPSFPKRTLNS